MRKNSLGKYVSAINTDNSSKHLERKEKVFRYTYIVNIENVYVYM